MAGRSSGTVSVATTEKWRFLRTLATAGPERSARSPRAEESLTVRTAAVRASGVEEDIFFFLCFPAIPSGLIEQAQAFHQQALRVQRGGLLCGFSVEVDLEVACRPAQNFEHCSVASQGSISCVRHLAFAEVHLAFFAFIGERERTALTPHLQRLH